MAEYDPIEESDLVTSSQALVWELADWIVYQREPEMYDAL